MTAMKHLVCTGLLALSATATWAQSVITVQEPWVRATVGQQTATGAFMRITAPADSRVLQVQSPLAGVVEIHEMKMEGDVMKMNQVVSIDLASNKNTEFKHGSMDGFHVMLIGIKKPLKVGDKFKLTLQFKNAGSQEVEVWVDAPKAGAEASSMHSH